jgi:glycosyltransferase involved in cell wall biosynthesis
MTARTKEMKHRNSFRPDFSVIIPAFNSPELFRDALESVICQRGVTTEIIVADDSTDAGIEAYLTKLRSPQIIYFHHVPSLGAVKNWNYGLSQARGNYLILLHHDERLSGPDHLKECLVYLESQDPDLLITNIAVQFPDQKQFKQKIPFILKRLVLSYFPSLLYTVNLIGPTACIVFKRELLAPFNENLKWLVDADWYYRLLKKNKSLIIDQLFVISCFGHKNQITLNLDRDRAEKEDEAVIRKGISFFSSVSLALALRKLVFLIQRNLHIKKNPFWNSHENR